MNDVIFTKHEPTTFNTSKSTPYLIARFEFAPSCHVSCSTAADWVANKTNSVVSYVNKSQDGPLWVVIGPDGKSLGTFSYIDDTPNIVSDYQLVGGLGTFTLLNPDYEQLEEQLIELVRK